MHSWARTFKCSPDALDQLDYGYSRSYCYRNWTIQEELGKIKQNQQKRQDSTCWDLEIGSYPSSILNYCHALLDVCRSIYLLWKKFQSNFWAIKKWGWTTHQQVSPWHNCVPHFHLDEHVQLNQLQSSWCSRNQCVCNSFQQPNVLRDFWLRDACTAHDDQCRIFQPWISTNWNCSNDCWTNLDMLGPWNLTPCRECSSQIDPTWELRLCQIHWLGEWEQGWIH